MANLLDFLDDIKFWFIIRWYWWRHRNDTPVQRQADRKVRVLAFHRAVEDFKNENQPASKTFYETVEVLEECKRIIGD